VVLHFLIQKFTVLGVTLQYWMVVGALGAGLILVFFSYKNSR
jgi:hypothetical protein